MLCVSASICYMCVCFRCLSSTYCAILFSALFLLSPEKEYEDSCHLHSHHHTHHLNFSSVVLCAAVPGMLSLSFLFFHSMIHDTIEIIIIFILTTTLIISTSLLWFHVLLFQSLRLIKGQLAFSPRSSPTIV